MATLAEIGKKNYPYFSAILPEREQTEDSVRIGLMEEKRAVGAVEVKRREGVCEIGSIYVLPGERNKGFGTQLLQAVEKLSTDNNLISIWADYGTDPALSGFFEKLGYVVLDGNTVYEAPISAFCDEKKLGKYVKKTDTSSLRTVGKLTKQEQKTLSDLLIRGKYAPDSFVMAECDKDLSLVHQDDQGRVDACLLSSVMDKRVFITLIFNGTRRLKLVVFLLWEFARRARADKRGFETLCFYSEKEKVVRLAKLMVEDEKVLTETIRTQSAIKVLDSGDLMIPEEQ